MKFDNLTPITQMDAVRLQIAILEVLAIKASSSPEKKPEPRYSAEILEIAKEVGLKDLNEVQRYLYILEGQQMVSPIPHGDLTSDVWCITSRGNTALEKFRFVLLAA
jgi:hypothetical protein